MSKNNLNISWTGVKGKKFSAKVKELPTIYENATFFDSALNEHVTVNGKPLSDSEIQGILKSRKSKQIASEARLEAERKAKRKERDLQRQKDILAKSLGVHYSDFGKVEEKKDLRVKTSRPQSSFTHDDIVAANMRNKHLKRMRKLERRSLEVKPESEIYDAMVSDDKTKIYVMKDENMTQLVDTMTEEPDAYFLIENKTSSSDDKVEELLRKLFTVVDVTNMKGVSTVFACANVAPDHEWKKDDKISFSKVQKGLLSIPDHIAALIRKIPGYDNHSEQIDRWLMVVALIYLQWKHYKDKDSRALLTYLLLDRVMSNSDLASKLSYSFLAELVKTAVESLPVFETESDEVEVKAESLSDDLQKLRDSLGSPSELLEKISRGFKAFLTSSISIAFRDLLMVIMSAHILPKEYAMEIAKHFGMPTRMDVISMITSALDSVISIVRAAELLISGTPLSDILFSGNPIAASIEESKKLMSYDGRFTTTLPRDGYIDQREWMRRAEKILPILRNALENSNPLKPIHKSIYDAYTPLFALYESIHFKRKVASRRPPIGVILVGEPGIGKSTLLDFIYNTFCQVKGVAFDSNMVFNRTMSSQYWETYNMNEHLITHLSEPGNKKADVVRSKGDPILDEICSMIDAAPYPLDMAFGEKGNVFFNSELVVIDTNSADMNLTTLYKNAAALKRRFLYITPEVLPEFRKGDSVMIDPLKGADRRLNDKYSFRVTSEEALSSSKSVTKVHFERANIDELADFLRKYFAKRIEEDESIRNLKIADRNTFYGLEEKVHEVKAEAFFEKPRFDGWALTVMQISKVTFSHFCSALAYFTYGALITLTMETKLATLYREKHVKEFFAMMFMVTQALIWSFFSNPKLYAIWAALFQFAIFILMDITLRSKLSTEKANAFVRARHHYDNLKAYWTVGTQLLYTSEAAILLASLVTLSGLVVGGWALFKAFGREKTPKKVFPQAHSKFVVPSFFNDALNLMEEKSNSELSVREVKGTRPDVWNVITDYKSVVSTTNSVTLDASLRSNVRLAKIVTKDRTVVTTIFGLIEDFCLVNTHSLPIGDFEIAISMTGSREGDGQWKRSLITEGYRSDVGSDVTVLRVTQLSFKNALKHVIDTKVSKSTGSVSGDQVIVQPFPQKLKISDAVVPIIVEDAFLYDWSNHKVGKCGNPVYLDVAQGRSAIIGIHCSNLEGTDNCFCAPLMRTKLTEAVKAIKDKSKFLSVLSQSDEMKSLLVPSTKSAFRFENLHNLDYIGYDGEKIIPSSRSTLKYSPIRVEVLEILKEEMKFEPTKVFMPPMMKHGVINGEWISPYNVNLKKMNAQRKPLDRTAMNSVIEAYTERFITILESNGVKQLNPLTFVEAVNGAKDDAMIRRINASTGAGYGFVGKKDDWIPVVEDNETFLLREMTEELKRKVLYKAESYEQGVSTGVVYGAKLKDEPREVSKVMKGKTRMFYPAPIDFLITCRMYFAPFFTAFCQFGDDLGTKIGVNMMAEGDRLFKRYRDFADSEECLFDGDYGSYDVSMPYEISHAASSIVYQVCKHFGYSDFALTMLEGLMTDMNFPTVEVLHDLFTVAGLTTSGGAYTAELNSLKNNVMMMYYFAITPGLGLDKYWTHFLKDAFGDDVTGVVKNSIKHLFNIELYSHFVKDVLGMDFTAPDKTEANIAFRKLSDYSFLKRGLVKHVELPLYVAPLDLESICKMLTWMIPSPNVTLHEQMVSTCNSALWELFLHCDYATWSRIRARLSDTLKKHFPGLVNDADLVIWQKICVTVYPDAMMLKEEEASNQEDTNGGLYVAGTTDKVLIVSAEADTVNYETISLAGDLFSDNRASQKTKLQWLLDEKNVLERHIMSMEIALKGLECPFGTLHPDDVIHTQTYFSNQSYREATDAYLAILIDLKDTRNTLEYVNRKIRIFVNNAHLVTESDASLSHTGAIRKEVTDTHENLTDVGGEQKDEVSFHHAFNHPVSSEDLQLKGFFARPVQVAKLAVDLNSNFDFSFNIWSLFLGDPTVRAKLRNYAFMRCNLNVRVAVSGTPFHYGRLLVSYVPFPSVNQPFSSFGPTYRYERLKYLSQCPGARTIDVRENTPFEMHVPYVSPQHIGRLYNDSNLVLSSSTPFADFDKLGSLYISTLNPIKATATGATNVYLYVYVYADDVQLGSATGTLLDVTAESLVVKGEADEREVGPVESFATNALKITKMAEMVPVISPYAKASSMVMSALKGVASLFGWSYPVLIGTPVRMRPDPFQNGAQTVGQDTGKRITLDPKCELSVDPRIVGVDQDELTINSIVKRESLLSQFEWAPGTVPLVDSLWSVYVTPRANETLVVGSKVVAQPTALSFAATPFDCWRGSITYRFEIVSSNFHRGKLMFVYEPNTAQVGLISANLGTNKQYVKVIDIQETQSLSLTVDWNYPRPWARNIPDTLMSSTVGDQFSTSAGMFSFANGVLLITPFTELQSPDSSSIAINVYVSSQNMKFNRLTDSNFPLLTDPFAVEVKGESDTLNQRDNTNMGINSAIMDDSSLSSDFFGEMPLSFRALLKRFQSMYAITEPSGGGVNNNMKFVFKVWPDRATVDEFSNNATLYHYLRKAYLAQRGNLRRRLLLRFNDSSSAFHHYVSTLVRLYPDATTTQAYGAGVYDNPISPSYSVNGSVIFYDNVNAGIEVEVPNYSSNLFQWACNDDPWYSLSVIESKALRNYEVLVSANGAYNAISVEESFATGEDFNLMRWIAAYPVTLNASSPG